jgi:hypothetical protein
MSTRRYIISSVAIIALLATGFFLAIRSVESKSIINVLNKHSQLVQSLSQRPADKTMSQRKFDAHKYIDGLTQMDMSFCPKRFEAAWLGYVQATERAFDQRTIRSEFVMGMMGVATKSPSSPPLPAKPPEARGEVESAWQNVERVALDYDVRIIHQS